MVSRMANLVILTVSFPYEGGEQFIESEIIYWSNTKFRKVLIYPSRRQGVKRSYPESINVLNGISSTSSKLQKIYFALLGFLSTIFWKELKYLFISKKINFTNIYYALAKVAGILNYSKYLKKSIKDINGEIIIYSYWNDVSYYAACFLKRKGIVSKVISRAHGFDVYEERHSNNYMPLKRQFRYDVDKVFLLSDRALSYYQDKYNYSLDRLEVARLGVVLPIKPHEYFVMDNELSVLSLSYCVSIKRIDKIMDAINTFSIKHNVKVKWTHIGAGELFDDLKKRALNIAQVNRNFDINFLGQLSNSSVHNWLLENNVNAFINASESEGVPVSIMEAMSFGIPAIAPNIGGISDLVNEKNGFLMSSNADVTEIVIGLETILFSKDILVYKKNARATVEDKYNSKKNYKEFVHKIEELTLNE
jgi:glycosyltransferase involved in cell wall biosynthesis